MSTFRYFLIVGLSLSLIYGCGSIIKQTSNIDTDSPVIVSTFPTNKAIDIVINSSITATFSESIESSTLISSLFFITSEASSIEGTISYSNLTAIFVPLNNLSSNTKYIATLKKDVKDLAGNNMKADYSWMFTTGINLDDTAPLVSLVSPVNGATDVLISSEISSIFSETVNPSTVNSNTFGVSSNEGNIFGTITCSDEIVTFMPSSTFSYNTTYTATISSSIEDLSGNKMINDYTWNFKTLPSPSWGGTILLGTTGSDYGMGVVVDSSGDIYVAGMTEGSLGENGSSGNYDVLLIKYDSAGIRKWITQLGTDSEDWVYSIAIDSDKNIYVVGETKGTFEENISSGGMDWFLIKFNSSGQKQWVRQFGTAYDDIAYGVTVSANGNVYVAGRMDGSFNGSEYSGGADGVLVKYDSLGSRQWVRQFGTAYDDIVWGIALDSNENIYLCGGTKGNLYSVSSTGDLDVFLAKYTSENSFVWGKQPRASDTDIAADLIVSSDGSIYICGYTSSSFDGNPQIGSYDALLLKYNSSNGEKEWSKQFGSVGSDQANCIDLDSSGNIYVGGGIGGSIEGYTTFYGATDCFLGKFNASSEIQWIKQLGTSGYDTIISLDLNLEGNIYTVGYSSEDLDSKSNSGEFDLFLVKYNYLGEKQ